jgi:predicted glutamine amidotransferase
VCEMLAVTAPATEAPLDLSRVLRWARLLDELGVAGYGWGMAWVDGSGLHRYRSVAGIRDDRRAGDVLADVQTRRLFIHLRRPSLMTTISHENAQPYWDPEAGVTFAHNGFLKRHRDWRPRYRDVLRGTSDSEVGFRYWVEQLGAGQPPAAALAGVHAALEGHANFMTLAKDGTLLVYAGNPENPCYVFRIGSLTLAATALHSLDDYLFQALFPEAARIERLDVGTVRELS